MTNPHGKSWLVCMPVPVVVYFTLLAYWAIKIIEGEAVNDWGQWLSYALACIIFLIVMAYNIRKGSVEGSMLMVLVIVHVFTAITVVLTGIYQQVEVSINHIGLSIALMTLLTVISIAIFKAIKF
ncbi:hypothetical protein HG702_22300 (plasmid) [Pectobacterium versatile]|nr:hypothetical protein HG702_22300 [Pectobacterium versatile]